MSHFRQEWILRSEKSTDRVFNIADVSLSAKEAQRRRATLSQSPAMQSSLPATVSFVQPDLFFPVAPFQNVSVTRKVNIFNPDVAPSSPVPETMIGPFEVIKALRNTQLLKCEQTVK